MIAWAGSFSADVTVSPSTADNKRAGDAAPVPFTPPSGTVIVPNVPDGEYHIVPNCGAMEAFYVFVVKAAPDFAG